MVGIVACQIRPQYPNLLDWLTDVEAIAARNLSKLEILI
jgi:hypothetical protein